MVETEANVSLRTTDLDEARAFLDPRFYSSAVAPAGAGGRLSARMTVTTVGELTIGDVAFGADLRVAFAELDCYQVNVPLSGRLLSRQGTGEARLITPGQAVVYQPRSGPVEDRWSADCRAIGVKIQPDLLHRTLGTTLGATLGHDAVLGGPPELLASWCRLVRWLHADASHTAGLASHPLMGEQVQEAVVAGLLAVVNDRHRERLDSVRPAPPRAIRRVIDAVQAHPEEPYTLGSLARIAGLSPRAVQLGFRRHIGTTPMGFVRDVRLGRAHEELSSAEPSSVTVAAVAHRWGFVHLGRFARLYRDRYGVPPSQAIRR